MSSKMELTETWLAQLHTQGLKTTTPRRMIVEHVLGQADTFSPEKVVADLQEAQPGIGRATVYRTLKKLEVLGLLQRVQQPHDCQFYRACPNGPQHLLTCQQCGESLPFPAEIVQQLRDAFKRHNGFLLPAQPLQFFGLCIHCQHSDLQPSSIGAI